MAVHRDARSFSGPNWRTTFTSTLTTTRLDELISGGLERNAKRIVLYYATVILARAHDDVPIAQGVLLRSLVRGGPNNIWIVEKGGLRIRFGTYVRYAVYVEFGTRKTAAQPFLGPAVEFFRNQWGKDISGIFWTGGIRVQGI